MLQRHLLFRNILQQKLSSDEQNHVLGDAFLKLTTQDNALLSRSSGEHSDWHSIHRSNQVLRSLYTRCHMTLERAGRWSDGTERQNEGAESVNGLSSRCCAWSPECARSAFTKYRANGNQREPHHLSVPRPLLTPAGILRNSHERLCEPLPTSGWTEGCTWDFRAVECPPVPAPRPQKLLLNPGAPGELSASVSTLKSPSGLAERLCGSPGPDGRVCHADTYSLPQRIDDADTDADVGDTSVFDYSSVTTCSPDDTLELQARDDDEEDEEEEDSEIPVLLKPSYTHTHAHTHSGVGLQRRGSVCTRWQIPRGAPLLPEVCVAGTGTGRRTVKHRRKIPTGAFRPIWDAPFKQV
ncbi:hypothetical protein Baya_8961 [Bagarius yarrelli]|uniref:Uncharacterized protein n=1 Tax=Bagarius yarrelli TaxID=175774 RepID=A0A556U702_BAGYA|nr:hypothetical protein Baya_8961 [Bagarius yarrelli]